MVDRVRDGQGERVLTACPPGRGTGLFQRVTLSEEATAEQCRHVLSGY